ncbi:MAG TPA: hypothetical protein VFN71_12440 [Methylomirabilota bacterium]|nr:hypothetical protein [Methylomirabilota bacterium]
MTPDRFWTLFPLGFADRAPALHPGYAPCRRSWWGCLLHRLFGNASRALEERPCHR